MTWRIKTSTSLCRIVMFATVLGGVWVSGRLVAAHNGGWRVGADDAAAITSPCGLSGLESTTCTKVVESRWGSFDLIVRGRRVLVPTSLVGFAYFIFLGVWLVIAPPGVTGSWWIDVGWRFGCAAAVIGSIFLVGVMGMSLGQWCPQCLVVHGLNVVSVVCIWLLSSSRINSSASHGAPADRSNRSNEVRPGWSPQWIVTGSVISACAVAGVWLYFDAVSDARHEWRKASAYKRAYEQLREDQNLVSREFLAQPKSAGSDPEIALASAEIDTHQAVVFADFDCAACRCFARAWRDEIAPSMSTPLHIEVRYLPRINDVDAPFASPSESTRAALAAEAARVQGGESARSRMIELLLNHRPEHQGRDYAALAQRIGLDPQQLLLDMESQRVRDRIMQDAALARAWGVTNTPAVLVDGRRVPPLCLNSRAFWNAVSSGAFGAQPESRLTRAEMHP